MRKRWLFGLVLVTAASTILSGCVAPINSESASVNLGSASPVVLVETDLPLSVDVDVAERHSDTGYGLLVVGRTSGDEWSQLTTEDVVGDYASDVQVSFPRAGLWETELRLMDLETREILFRVSGPEIEAFDEGTLDIRPVQSFDTWITGEAMPLVPAISPERLAGGLNWKVEILRGNEWEALADLDSESSVVPAFEDEDEALQSLRLAAFAGDTLFATGEPFELRVASPSTLIREAWNRENAMITPEELWEELLSSTYPGIQKPTDADRAYVIQVYNNQGMPRTSVLSETLVEVPEIDLEIEYKGRACSDPDVLEAGIEGKHFAYDVVWYLDRILAYSTFWEGKMYQHRSICYD
jgi:hypothetical protein